MVGVIMEFMAQTRRSVSNEALITPDIIKNAFVTVIITKSTAHAERA